MISTGAIRGLLLLTALAFICHAQNNQSGQKCLCSSFRDTVDSSKNISDLQIYPVSDFCGQVEIIISTKSGGRYCLNPNLRVAKKFLNNLIKSKK